MNLICCELTLHLSFLRGRLWYVIYEIRSLGGGFFGVFLFVFVFHMGSSFQS